MKDTMTAAVYHALDDIRVQGLDLLTLGFGTLNGFPPLLRGFAFSTEPMVFERL